jgi:DNA polymerase-3 subunit alpha
MNTNHVSGLTMVFDTETTGLFLNTAHSLPLHELPYMTQLAFLIYDEHSEKVVFRFSEIICVPDYVVISPEVTKITGITRELCDTRGIPIQDALQIFYREYMKCSRIVGHNIQFDLRILNLEYRRNINILSECPLAWIFLSHDYFRTNRVEVFCTMKYGIHVCNIMREGIHKETGEVYYYKKQPKLVELYQHLFNETPANLHDAMFDTEACFRCFIKIKPMFPTSMSVS